MNIHSMISKCVCSLESPCTHSGVGFGVNDAGIFYFCTLYMAIRNLEYSIRTYIKQENWSPVSPGTGNMAFRVVFYTSRLFRSIE